MFDERLRGWKDFCIDPLLSIIGPRYTPTQLTLLGFAWGLLMFLFLCIGYPTLALLCWILNRIFDGLDGAVARKYNKQTDFGGYIDILCDFTIYGILPVGVYINAMVEGHPRIQWLSVEIMILEVLFFVNSASLFMHARIEEQRKTTVTMKGLIEGFESMVLFTGMIVCPQYIEYILHAFGAGVICTIIQRILTF